MKIITKAKRLISLALIFCIAFSSFVSANAFETTSTSVQRGSAIELGEVVSNVNQIKELLRNCNSTTKRQMILEKAVVNGVTASDLSDVALSDTDKAILNQTIDVVSPSNFSTKSVLRNPTQNTRGTIVANVDMPDYALWPTIYMQEENDYCSAATIQTVLQYITESSPTQTTIMNAWGGGYPTIVQLMNYINNRLGEEYNPYYQQVYAGNQTTFNVCLKWDVENYQPMIILMSSSDKTNWPYRTGGHFCICNGLLTWEDNKYFMGDPFYFSTYVSGAGNVGTHNKTWSQLNTVITNKFGTSNACFLW